MNIVVKGQVGESSNYLKKKHTSFYISFSFDRIFESYHSEDEEIEDNYADCFLRNFFYIFFYLLFLYKYNFLKFYFKETKEVEVESIDYFYKKKAEQLLIL